MGLSQAKWRTLLHLSLAPGTLTQAEIAERLGIEEPSLVTLLHRLEREGWITRKSSPLDRRCKMVLLGRRAQHVIAGINAAADKLRHELLADIPRAELQTCIKVLARIRQKVENNGKLRKSVASPAYVSHDGQTRNQYRIPRKMAPRGAARKLK